MHTYEEVKRIKEKHERELLEKQGVTAIGVGRKGDSDVYCIRVYLSKSPDQSDHVPSDIEGVEVEVVYTGPIKAN